MVETNNKSPNNAYVFKNVIAWLCISLFLFLLMLTSCGYHNSLYESNPTVTVYFVVENSPHKQMKKQMVRTARKQGFYISTADSRISFEDDFWASFIRKDMTGHASTAGDEQHFTVSLNKSKYFATPSDDYVISMSEIFRDALDQIEGVTYNYSVVNGEKQENTLP